MKDRYRLYSGKKSVGQEEVRNIIAEYYCAIKENGFQRHKHIVDMIPVSCGTVLDYGCGWGCVTRAIGEKGNRVIGIDQFDGALEVARDFNSHSNVEFLKKQITDFSPESFDLVNSNQVLEHVHNPGIYLMNVNRVLKTGGSLIISVPNVINLHYFWRQLSRAQSAYLKKISSRVLSSYSKDSDHIQAWEPGAFVRLHASLGFEYMEHRYLEGMYLPFGECRHVTVPWGGRYFHTKNRRLKNLSYTMAFSFRKERFVSIAPED